MNIKERVITKILSGRWLLTVIAGLVFAYVVWKRIMPEAATAAILVDVFNSYFHAKRREREKNED